MVFNRQSTFAALARGAAELNAVRKHLFSIHQSERLHLSYVIVSFTASF